MNRDAQSSDHMLNRNHMLNRQTAHAQWLKQNVSIILINFSAVSMRQGVDFFSERVLGFSDQFTKIDGDEPGCLV